MTRRIALVLMSLLTVGSAAAACHKAPDVALPGSADNVITRDELDSAGAASVYDAIARRHALFFRDRGTSSLYGNNVTHAVVFIGDQYYGEIPTLRNLPVERFQSVRYYTGTEAASRFGSQYHAGVIQLIPRYE